MTTITRNLNNSLLFLQKKSSHKEKIEEFEEVAGKSKVLELDSHTITVTEFTDLDFVGSDGVMLGLNKVCL